MHPCVRHDMTHTQTHPSWFAAVQMPVFGICYASHKLHDLQQLSVWGLSVRLRAMSKGCCTACPAHIPKLTGRLLIPLACIAPFHAQSRGMH